MRRALPATITLLLLIPAAAMAGVVSTINPADLPAATVLHNVEVSGTKLVLSRDRDGNYYSEGYVDIPFTLPRTGALLQVDATRVNLFVNGDFQSDQTVRTYLAASVCTSCTRVAKGTGYWLTASDEWIIPQIVADPEDAANYVVKFPPNIYSARPLLQIVPVTAGATYSLSFDADLTSMATDTLSTVSGETESQGLVVSVGFQDTGFNNITLLNPDGNTTATKEQMHVFYAAEGKGNMRLKIRAPDCNTQTKYQADDGTYASDVTFNMCQDAGGAALTATSDDGTVTTSYGTDDIRYAAVSFNSSWIDHADASDYFSLIDNLQLYRDDEIEVEIRNAAGKVVQSSTVADGFFAAPAAATTLRVYLRSDKPDQTPEVNAILVKDGWDLSVAITPNAAKFTGERLGTLYVVGPWTDYFNPELAIRSLCRDPLAGDQIPCMQLDERYHTGFYRMGLISDYLQTELTTDGTDYDLFLTEKGETVLARILELARHGMEPLLVLLKTGALQYEDPDAGSTRSTYVDEIPDPTGVRTSAEQALHLMRKYARFWVELFNGSTDYTYRYIRSGATVRPPKVTRWEIFNEDNIVTTEWRDFEAWGDIADATERAAVAQEMTDLAESFADIVKTGLPEAEISTSGLASHYGPVFNTEDLETYLATLDPARFDMVNFHPYANNLVRPEFKEEAIRSRWTATEDVLARYGFSGKEVLFTEYGETHQIYDPGCAYDTTSKIWQTQSTPTADWQRGYGDKAFGKLVARETLTLLGLPATRIKFYGAHTWEDQSIGSNTDYACWRSDWKYQFNLFERVPGTGILAGLDKPSEYVANAGGKAYFTIAKYLSHSRPLKTMVESVDKLTTAGRDYFHAQAYATAGGKYIVAVWWYQDYSYGDPMTWMSFIDGTRNVGFGELRNFNVWISGIAGINSAKLIKLDGSGETTDLSLVSLTAGVVVQGVVTGELPVLIELDAASASPGKGDPELTLKGLYP